ncbi:MAG: Ltp family lipoprotein [Eggerthellaceae bacterium]
MRAVFCGGRNMRSTMSVIGTLMHLRKRRYQDTMSMSPEAIRDHTSEYGEQFTQEEADYAVANL